MHELKRKTPQVRFEHWKAEEYFEEGKKFIEDICLHLKLHFDIETTIGFPKQRGNRKDGIITRPIRVYILGDSVKKFHKQVGFSNHKQQTLKTLLAD